MKSFHIYLKNGGDFTVIGKDYSFDMISLTIYDKSDHNFVTIRTELLKLVRYYDPDCRFDYESEKVLFHAM